MTIEEVKEMGIYKITFKSDLQDTDDYITLEVRLTDDLWNLLRSISVMNETVVSARVENGYDDESDTTTFFDFKRYKAKRYVYNGLSQDFREMIFNKEIVDTGRMNIKLKTIELVETYIRGLKQNYKSLIEILIKIRNINQTTTFQM